MSSFLILLGMWETRPPIADSVWTICGDGLTRVHTLVLSDEIL